MSNEQRARGRMVLIIFVLVCVAPIAASYLFYFVIKPQARTNYGQLIEPQRNIPALDAVTLDGKPFDLNSLAGRWVMVTADQGACPLTCVTKLYQMRQIRVATGKERERIERVWLISDQDPVPQVILDAYQGTIIVRVDPARLTAWLPATDSWRDHLYLIDPHQHLMLEFPDHPDPYRIKRDLGRLLSASEIG